MLIHSDHDKTLDCQRNLLKQMFDAAIATAQPSLCVPPYLPEIPTGRLVVIGAGKASATMVSHSEP